MAKKKIPEELDSIWSDELELAWKKLNQKQQDFLIEWLNNGQHGTNAYWKVYNKNATEKVAGVCASQYLGSPRIDAVLSHLYGNKKYALLKARKRLEQGLDATKTVFSKSDEPMDIEDFGERRKNAIELLKLAGEYTEKIEHSGVVSIAQQIIDAYGSK